MLTFQGFLFASFALVANVSINPTIRSAFGIIVPIVGITVGALTLIGVIAAYVSIDYIKCKLREKLGDVEFRCD